MAENELLIKVEHMSKSFGVTRALKDVHFELSHGQIHGLIGENGSGKSTLGSIIACMRSADEGKVFYEGKVFNPKNPIEASKQGVCMILQEKGTFERVSVAENIFIGKENMFVRTGYLNVNRMIKAAQDALDKIGASHIKAAMPLVALNFEDRKLVEVARAMLLDPKVLIVDETTTALSRDGREILYNVMHKMKEEGNSVIFISHDIDELMEQCDHLTVLRDGDYVATLEKSEFNAGVIRQLMVGREVADNYFRSDYDGSYSEEVALSMEGVYSPDLRDISFELHKGEILGFGGLADCGMHALGNIAFGLTPPDLGKVKMGNGKIINSPKTATLNKIAYMSKNRDTESLMTSASIKDNICLASLKDLQTGIFIFGPAEKTFVRKWSDKLEIKMRDPNQFVMELSGGNKQKVALAKWLGFGADILIMDCPTRGIDIGVKTNIYRLMEELKAEGKSIILISEELPEVIGMSDRIIILKDGAINGEFTRSPEVTESKLIDYMI